VKPTVSKWQLVTELENVVRVLPAMKMKMKRPCTGGRHAYLLVKKVCKVFDLRIPSWGQYAVGMAYDSKKDLKLQACYKQVLGYEHRESVWSMWNTTTLAGHNGHAMYCITIILDTAWVPTIFCWQSYRWKGLVIFSPKKENSQPTPCVWSREPDTNLTC